MARQPDIHPEAAPPGLTDFVATFRRGEQGVARSQVFRAADADDALELVLAAATNGRWTGWDVVEVITVTEAMQRRGIKVDPSLPSAPPSPPA